MDKLSPEQKAPLRKTRRAPNRPDVFQDRSFDSGSPESETAPVAPPRSRRTGGWADDTLKSAKPKLTSSNSESDGVTSPNRLRRLDSDDDIPIIPDMEDISDEMLNELADAPVVSTHKTTAFSDFDSDLKKKSGLGTLDGLNLNILTKYLHSDTELKEPDVRWTWDLLFTEVSSELRLEKESENTKM